MLERGAVLLFIPTAGRCQFGDAAGSKTTPCYVFGDRAAVRGELHMRSRGGVGEDLESTREGVRMRSQGLAEL